MYICCFLFSDVCVLFVLRCLIYGPGIFLMRAVMLRSLWMTAMVIKSYLERCWKSWFHQGGAWKDLAVLILFLLPPEMGLCWSVLYPEFPYVLSLRYFLLILRVLSTNGFSNSLRFRIWWLIVDNDA